MKNFITPIFLLLLPLLVIDAHAESKEYNIEIVIFEDTSNRYINSEQWPVIHHPENDSLGEIVGSEYPKTNSVINITHHSSDALAGHVARLKRSSRYNVLLHQSWQQTGLSDTDAISFPVDTSAKAKKGQSPILNPDLQANQDLKSSVQGTFKLILGRYLHIHVDLLYKRLNEDYKQTSPALNSKTFSEYIIKAQRRMRSKELHYIDHPLLGILVMVVPIEAVEKEGSGQDVPTQ